MASSVSSEQAFSSAGITISKRHSCLKGDIVEALQALKYAIHCNLLFCNLPSSTIEADKRTEKLEDAARWDDGLSDDGDDKDGDDEVTMYSLT
jgi:hypothetical protein